MPISRVDNETRKAWFRPAAVSAVVFSTALALVACAPPGGTGSTGGPVAGGTATCGTEDVVLSAYIETGFPLAGALFDEFTKQFPNVTFDVREDQFAALTAERSARAAGRPAGPHAHPADVRAGIRRSAARPRLVRRGARLDRLAGVAARAAAGRRRGPTRQRTALRDGSQLLDDRRVLQQGPRRADRDDGGAEESRRARRLHRRRPRTPGSPRWRSSTAAPPVGSRSRCRR